LTRDVDRGALREQCSSAIQAVTAATRRIGCGDWLALDLSMGQLKALMTLVATGPQPVGGLARVLGIAEPSASALADKLQAEGLATREADPADRRRTLVTPTARAVDLVDHLQRLRDEQFNELLERLDDEQLAALAAGLGALARAAVAAPASAPVAAPGAAS
jgi:DNA-binding MarR family transcriptional regulator